jgi:lipoprotein-anchoring transpeptidase ErfK/SrfK
MVLKVGEVVETPERIWYEIVFDEWLRYPERVSGKWYVAGEYVQEIRDVGPVFLTDTSLVTNKVITVDRSDQLLYAYDGDVLYMKESISTGLAFSPTPRGTFTIFKKLPSRYMQGPLQYLAFSKYYDLPGVPWNLYFTEQGAVVHGTYWHDSFGQPYSSGCVNVDPALAKRLYDWAPIGTKVVVQD